MISGRKEQANGPKPCSWWYMSVRNSKAWSWISQKTNLQCGGTTTGFEKPLCNQLNVTDCQSKSIPLLSEKCDSFFLPSRFICLLCRKMHKTRLLHFWILHTYLENFDNYLEKYFWTCTTILESSLFAELNGNKLSRKKHTIAF